MRQINYRKTGSRWLIALLLLACCLPVNRSVTARSISNESAVTPDITTAPLLPINQQVIDDRSADQTDPHVDCNMASYTDEFNQFAQLTYFNFLTNTGGVVTGPFDVFLSDIDGTRITFTSITASGSTIYVFDSLTGDIFTVPNVTNGIDSSLGGSLVAFEQLSPSSEQSEVSVFDLETNTLTQLTNDGLKNLDPIVSPTGDAVIFQKCQISGLGCDVYAAIRTAPGVFTLSQLTGSTGEETNVDTNGSIVVYESLVNGDRNIAYQPIGGGAEVQIVLPDDQRNPSIAGNLISFESIVSPGNYDLFAYDSASDRLYRLTDTPAAEFLNDITFCSGQFRVVYAKPGAAGDADIHAFTFQLPESPSDEIEVVLDVVVSFDLPDGIQNSLITKLQNALDALEAGDTASACSSLRTFISGVQAQSGKKITTSQADQLINFANQIKQTLGCQ